MKRNIDTTLLVVVKDNKILLAQKKRGFGVNLYNGVGGKRQEGETVYEAMVREAMEESSIKPLNAENVAIIDFDLYLKGENVTEKMFIYLAHDYEGTVTESEEMRPEWFDIDNIPYDRMFADDILWLPEVLKGNKVVGSVVFDKEFNLLEKEMRVVDSLPESK